MTNLRCAPKIELKIQKSSFRVDSCVNNANLALIVIESGMPRMCPQTVNGRCCMGFDMRVWIWSDTSHCP